MTLATEWIDREAFTRIPRLGWVEEPTPITALPALAAELGLAWLGVKRDDLCRELVGGSKVRKLDFALATPRLAGAREWVSVGAIGSGHLVALTAAAARLDRHLLALCFFEPLGAWIEENLAYIASGPTELRYFRTRLRLAMTHPRAVLAERAAGRASIPPGATDAAGLLGMVRAGVELAEQIRAGVMPEVERVYVPLGTGGTAAGLAVGLGLGGVRAEVRAIAAVERAFSGAARLERLTRRALAALHGAGVQIPEGAIPARVHVDRRMLGRGYGHATPASLREVATLAEQGLPIEPVYGGKALAALRADSTHMSGARVLFWLTSHSGALPRSQDWEARLPRGLCTDLAAARAGRMGRRRALAAVVTAGATVALGVRLGFHADVEGWEGNELHEWEGAVLAAAAEALVPEVPGGALPGGVTADRIAVHVDRFLVGMPGPVLLDLHGLFALIEQGTLLGGAVPRLTRLSPRERRDTLTSLASHGGELGKAVRALRDLCYLGYYQDAHAWPQLAYRGPWARATDRSAYDILRAPEGAIPPGATR